MSLASQGNAQLLHAKKASLSWLPVAEDAILLLASVAEVRRALRASRCACSVPEAGWRLPKGGELSASNQNYTLMIDHLVFVCST